jgi:hypothetical protein
MTKAALVTLLAGAADTDTINFKTASGVTLDPVSATTVSTTTTVLVKGPAASDVVAEPLAGARLNRPNLAS